MHPSLQLPLTFLRPLTLTRPKYHKLSNPGRSYAVKRPPSGWGQIDPTCKNCVDFRLFQRNFHPF